MGKQPPPMVRTSLSTRLGWHLACLHGTGIFAPHPKFSPFDLSWHGRRSTIASDLVKRMHWLGNQGNHEGPKMPDCSGPEAKWLTGANRLGLRFQSPKMSDCSRPEAKWLTVRTAWDFGFWIPLGCHDLLGLLALSCHSLSPSFLIGLLLNF